MSRYWRVYRTFFLTSITRELEFRANFFAKVLQNLVWMAFFVLVLLVIYRNTDSVAGWSRGDSFILAGTGFLLSAVSQGLLMSLHEIPEQVRLGTLDFVVTKPIDSQFWVSTRKFNFNAIGIVVAAVAVMSVGVVEAKVSPSLLQWGAFFVLILASQAIFYSFSLAMMTLGVWFVRVDNLWVLADSVVYITRYPMDIYQGLLKTLFIYVVPLAFLATIPAKQLVVGFDPVMLGLGVVWAAVFLALSRIFWRFAMRHYTSASS